MTKVLIIVWLLHSWRPCLWTSFSTLVWKLVDAVSLMVTCMQLLVLFVMSRGSLTCLSTVSARWSCTSVLGRAMTGALH